MGPQINLIIGSFFPSWMLCALIGIVATLLARWLFVRSSPAFPWISTTPLEAERHGAAVLFGWAFAVQVGVPVPAIPMLLGAGALAAGEGAYQAPQQAYGHMYRTVPRQAQTLASVGTFWLLALSGAVMVALSLLLKKTDLRAGGQVPVQ